MRYLAVEFSWWWWWRSCRQDFIDRVHTFLALRPFSLGLLHKNNPLAWTPPPPPLLGLTHTNESTRSLFNTWSSSYVHPPFDFSQSSFNLLPASRASSRLHRERLCRGIPIAGLRELPGRSAGPRVTFSACEIVGAMLSLPSLDLFRVSLR